MKRFAIIGTGAIGGYHAVRLAKADFEVHCLLRSDYEHVKQNGLVIETNDQTIHASVNAHQDINTMPKCDVILVALKTTSNYILKDLLPNIIHADTVVVLLQNGIGMEQELAKFINPENIIGASALLKVKKVSPGRIKHFALIKIELAQYFPDIKQQGITKQVAAITAIFNQACINTEAVPHLPTLRWKKLAGNIPINGLSVILDAYTYELANNPSSHELICEITKEVIETAKKCGAQIPEDFYEFRLKILNSAKKVSLDYTSMKNDFNAKQPLELHAIYENTLNIAQQHRVDMPLTKVIYQQLVYLNQKNLAK